jgi:hypothetical protein
MQMMMTRDPFFFKGGSPDSDSTFLKPNAVHSTKTHTLSPSLPIRQRLFFAEEMLQLHRRAVRLGRGSGDDGGKGCSGGRQRGGGGDCSILLLLLLTLCVVN